MIAVRISQAQPGGQQMSRRVTIALAGLVLSVAVIQPVRAEVTAAQVDEAIRTGTAYLLKRQDKATGSWTEYKGEPGGLTALATLALLNSGVPKDDPQVKAALAYLEKL